LAFHLSRLTTLYKYKNIFNDPPNWSVCANFDHSWHGLTLPDPIVGRASNRSDIVSQQDTPFGNVLDVLPSMENFAGIEETIIE
jgi:hypothetical protein